jgi:hypothetical protein
VAACGYIHLLFWARSTSVPACGEERYNHAHLLRRGLGVPGGPEFLTIDDLYLQLIAAMQAEGLAEGCLSRKKRGTDTADLSTFGTEPSVRGCRRATSVAAPGSRDRARRERSPGSSHQIAARHPRRATTHPRLRASDTLLTRQYLGRATGGAGDPIEGAMLRTLLAERTGFLGPGARCDLSAPPGPDKATQKGVIRR